MNSTFASSVGGAREQQVVLHFALASTGPSANPLRLSRFFTYTLDTFVFCTILLLHTAHYWRGSGLPPQCESITVGNPAGTYKHMAFGTRGNNFQSRVTLGYHTVVAAATHPIQG